MPDVKLSDFGADLDVQSLAARSWQAVRLLEKKNSNTLKIILKGDIQVTVRKHLLPRDTSVPICFYELSDYLVSKFWKEDQSYTKIIKFVITPLTSYVESLRCIEKHV